MTTWIVAAVLGLAIGSRVYWLRHYGPVEKTIEGVYHHRFLSESTTVRQLLLEWARHSQAVWSFEGESKVYLSKGAHSVFIIATLMDGGLNRLEFGVETVEQILNGAPPRQLCADMLRTEVARYKTATLAPTELPLYLHGWDGASR